MNRELTENKSMRSTSSNKNIRGIRLTKFGLISNFNYIKYSLKYRVFSTSKMISFVCYWIYIYIYVKVKSVRELMWGHGEKKKKNKKPTFTKIRGCICETRDRVRWVHIGCRNAQ